MANEAMPVAAKPYVRDARPTVSIMKACELTGVSRRTIYNWLALGKLEYFRTAGGAVRIVEESLWKSVPAGGDLKLPKSRAGAGW